MVRWKFAAVTGRRDTGSGAAQENSPLDVWHAWCDNAGAMIEINRILCPVDLSEFSRHALDHAAAVAAWYGARLTVLHVVPNMPVMDLPPAGMEENDRDRVLGCLRRFTQHVTKVPLEFAIEEASDVHQEILEQATALPADLLVVGTHGRSGFGRLLLGSVTEKLMRKSPCPTMVVPGRASDLPADAPVVFHRILCPVDFSDASIRALEYAVTLAEETDAELTLLHVIEMPPELREFPIAAGVDVESLHAATEADRLGRLQALVPDQARTYCTVQTEIREGATYRAILKAAAERQVGLIVMGVQGRGAIDLAIFGSNTARVARAASCPVLIVRG